MKINYGIIAVRKNEKVEPWSNPDFLEIWHFVGYEEKPNQDCFDSLLNELKTDNQFELTHFFSEEEGDKLVLIEAPEDIVKYYANIIENGSMV